MVPQQRVAAAYKFRVMVRRGPQSLGRRVVTGPNRLSKRKQSPTLNSWLHRRTTLSKSLESRFVRLHMATITRQQIKQEAALVARSAAPIMLGMLVSGVAHAQGSMDFSQAKTLMTNFQTFAMYAGAVICLGSLIFAGIRLMGGRFQDAIPGLFGALFGAGVLGWGAGWISSLTGQSVTQ